MSTRHRLFVLPVVLALAVLSLAACGGGSDQSKVASLADDGSAATPTAASSSDLEKKLNDYVECLRKQGVNLPDATVDAKGQVSFGQGGAGAGVDRSKLGAAQKKCGPLPEGLTLGGAGGVQFDDPAFQDAALKFAQCLRGQGVAVQDPDFSQISAGTNPFGTINQDDPKVAAAIKACQHVWTDAGINLRGGGS